jgi:hypothetical protein
MEATSSCGAAPQSGQARDAVGDSGFVLERDEQHAFREPGF